MRPSHVEMVMVEKSGSDAVRLLQHGNERLIGLRMCTSCNIAHVLRSCSSYHCVDLSTAVAVFLILTSEIQLDQA